MLKGEARVLWRHHLTRYRGFTAYKKARRGARGAVKPSVRHEQRRRARLPGRVRALHSGLGAARAHRLRAGGERARQGR